MSDPRQPTPPNLDLIQQVQRARMLHDAQARPSAMAAGYWLECKPDAAGPAPTMRAGEWVIHTSRAAADTQWEIVKSATQAGQLGYKSKISTAPAPGQAEAEARVILVRTYDADDGVDVARVRAALLVLGLPPDHYERG